MALFSFLFRVRHSAHARYARTPVMCVFEKRSVWLCYVSEWHKAPVFSFSSPSYALSLLWSDFTMHGNSFILLFPSILAHSVFFSISNFRVNISLSVTEYSPERSWQSQRIDVFYIKILMFVS